MNKCTQTISDRCTQILAGYVTCGKFTLSDKLSFSSTLKFSIINDPFISIDIDSPTEFSISESVGGYILSNSSAIAEARIADFLLGAGRVQRQYDDILRMKANGTNTAWLLVSTYYCAYFSCIEICKLFDRISMSFEQDDISDMMIKATGPYHAQFFSSGNTNFVGSEYAGKIVFRSVGAKPHTAAWDNVLYSVRKIFSKKSWPEADRYIDILSNNAYSPSRIRNSWNYKRSDYFGSTGDEIGIEFKKLIGNSGGATSWLNRKFPKIDIQDPCIVAVLCEAMAPAVIEAARRTREIMRQAAS